MQLGTSDTLSNVSDTALLTARIRGRESTREDRLFNDPLAFRLAGERGAKLAQEGAKKWWMRLLASSLRNAVVARTAIIDHLIERAVKSGEITQVINLGAGLDARPYRLNLPKNLKWIEIDLPGVIDSKVSLTKDETPCCELTRVKADLSKSEERQRVLAEIAVSDRPTLVLTEGLILYLEPVAVLELAEDLRKMPNVRRWIVDVNSTATLKMMAKIWRIQLGKNVEFQFGHDAAEKFFANANWKTLEANPVFEEGSRFTRRGPLTGVREVAGRVLGEKFKERMRRSSIVFELEPKRGDDA